MDQQHPSLPPRNPARLAGQRTVADAMPTPSMMYVVSSTDALIRQTSSAALQAASPQAEVPTPSTAQYDHMERWQKLRKAGGSEPPAHWQIKQVHPLTAHTHSDTSPTSKAASTASTSPRATEQQPDTPTSLARSRRDSAITLGPPASNGTSARSTQVSSSQHARPTTSTSSHPPRSIHHLTKGGDKGFWRDSTGDLVAWRMYLAAQEPRSDGIPKDLVQDGTAPLINPRRRSNQVIKDFARQSLETLRRPVQNRLRRRKASEALSEYF